MRARFACMVLALAACGGPQGGPDASAIDGAVDASVHDAGSDAGRRRDAFVPLPDAQAPRDAGSDAASLDGASADAGFEDASWPLAVTCATPPPPGAQTPAPLPTYAGTCPTLAPGRNTIRSGGADREFILVVPSGLDPSERPPLVFLWHWLGGDADDFLVRGEVQAGADAHRFLAVIPEAKGDLPLRWPYLTFDSDARVEEEARFFDDVLACVAEQFAINEQCVASAGVSAGALWTAQLVQRRSQHLSSFLSLSGGVGTGGTFDPIRRWTGAAHAVPGLVLWGGPTDWCLISFDQASRELEEGLVAGGHFLVECVHDCAHAQPPIEPPPGASALDPLWRFVLEHPYWLPDGASPWLSSGLPAGTPEWCAIGAGSATIRSGECEGGVLGDCT